MNIKAIANEALERSNLVIAHWLPQGKQQGSEWVSLNPTRSDSKPGSFSVNVDTGLWADFASDDKGGDLVALVAYLEGCKQSVASKKLADFLGLEEGDQQSVTTQAPATAKAKLKKTAQKSKSSVPVSPIPAQVSPPPAAHPRHGKPSATWVYRNAAGQDMFYVFRFDKKDGEKQILPLTWNGQDWQWKGLPAPRPLYNLNKLATVPDAPVLICEGEKSADAAETLFTQHVTTTSPNGCKAAAKADWSPLAGRQVFIWPDYDKPGAAYAEEVTRLAYEAGATSVSILDPQVFVTSKSNGNTKARKLPSGWDAADAVAEGWTAEDMAKMKENGKLFRQVKPEQQIEPNEKLPRFELREDGVYYLDIAYNKNLQDFKPSPPLWVCSPLRVVAYTRNESNEDWGRLLKFPDRDGREHQWAMPMSMLAGSGEPLRSELLRQGLEITTHTNNRRLLGDYLQGENPKPRARCVTRTGWHNGVFVFPERTLGETDEQFVFQAESKAGFTYAERGTLKEWRREVAALCVGNSRLVFAVSAGFASLLMGLTGDESGGIHYRGGCSSGKTTALKVASSLFGGANYVQRWRTTDNGLEALAVQHNHTLLILDELAQIDPKVAGEVAYMIGNGAGKTRSDKNSVVRPVKRWELLFLSAGEIGLAQHMAQANKRVKAGQEIRMIDIPADAGADLGIFENLHGYTGGAAFSRALNDAANTYYGTAALAFIEALIAKDNDCVEVINQARDEFIQQAITDMDASGQVHRAAARFGLVAVAGEMATAFDITGWAPGESEQAALTCFNAWVNARGGSGNQEETAILRQIRQFIESHGEARFSPWDRAMDDHAPRTSNRAGFVKKNEKTGVLTYFILPEVFRQEVCDGYDHKVVEQILITRGWITTDSESRAAKKVKLPGFGKQTRCYVLAMDKMEG